MTAPSDNQHQKLCRIQQFSYGIGHVLNDLCASIWFSYLLIYFHDVIEFDNVLAGYTMLAGQIADALATPFIGFEVDRTNGCCRYGKRKSWHIVGTLCVMVSFPFIFSRCIGCHHSVCWAQFIYYVPFVVIFQFGWAATQISHLSLIPQLTPCQNDRVGLNAIRYTFTVLSNIVVYGVTWFLLGTSQGTQRELTPADAPQFQKLVLILLAVGAVFGIIFHVGTKEDTSYEMNSAASDVNSVNSVNSLNDVPKSNTLRWSCWLKEHQFYQVALLYMCSRLIVNLSQVYLPMYLTSSLKLDKSYIAIIPLVVYVSGFLSALLMKPLNICAGRKVTYILGALTVIGYSVWTWFLSAASLWQVFAMAVLLGTGTSTVLVTSLSMTADLIDSSLSCINKYLAVDSSLSCINEYLAVDSSLSCKNEYLAVDSSLSCINEYLAVDSSLSCKNEYLAVESSLSCINEYLAVDSSLSCINEYLAVDSSLSCINEYLAVDSSLSCINEYLAVDSSLSCINEYLAVDSSLSCINEYLAVDSSLSCINEYLAVDSSLSCINEYLAVDSSLSCINEYLAVDSSLSCINEYLAGDSSLSCINEYLAIDSSLSCINEYLAVDSSLSCINEYLAVDSSLSCINEYLAVDSSLSCINEYLAVDTSLSCINEYLAVDSSLSCINEYLAVDSSLSCINTYLAVDSSLSCINEYLAVDNSLSCINEYLAVDSSLSCINKYLAVDSSLSCINEYLAVDSSLSCINEYLAVDSSLSCINTSTWL
ncbi:Major facilitator superfamily domain-containing protein 12 [Lamellibrachia satsuma]|nr:Major facilitator superfamily domain-containing protein 12 [Lamellibrachia satsuma]